MPGSNVEFSILAHPWSRGPPCFLTIDINSNNENVEMQSIQNNVLKKTVNCLVIKKKKKIQKKNKIIYTFYLTSLITINTADTKETIKQLAKKVSQVKARA